jgi:DNA-binding winged helix-turn-helix (wHTH) protein
LLFGADGQAIPLKPKVFDTLLYFVEHAGELLDKFALMRAVWGNVIVEENSLNQNISALRQAFGEKPGENRFIVTVPGRGYSFVSTLHTNAVQRPPAPVAALPAPGSDHTPSLGSRRARVVEATSQPL